MSLVARLVRLVREVTGGEPDRATAASPDVEEEHLAVAALLVHVARVDGRVVAGERRALLNLLETGYGLDRRGAEALVMRAEQLDLEVDDVGSLVEMLGHEGEGADGLRLLGMAYGVAAAEGGIGEFEESLLWRLGRLLRIDDAVAAEIKRDALGEAVAASEGGA